MQIGQSTNTDRGPTVWHRNSKISQISATPPEFRGRGAITVQLWWIVQALLFHTSPQFLYGWRRWRLRRFGAEIGEGVLLRPSIRVTYPWKVRIGDRSQIADRSELYSLGEIEIGADVMILQGCDIRNGGTTKRGLIAPYIRPLSSTKIKSDWWQAVLSC